MRAGMPWVRAAVLFCGTSFFLLPMTFPATAGAADEPAGATASQPAGDVAPVRSGEAEVLFNKGRVAYYNGNFHEAETAFRSLLAMNADDAQAQYYLGLSLTGQDRPKEAVDALNRALAIDPSLTEARAGRASAEILA